MAGYVVKANLHGRRIATKVYKTRAEAQAYADQSNKDGWAKNARVKKV